MTGKARSLRGHPEYDGHLGLETDETVCVDCGLVVSEHHVDHDPEWCSFAGGDRNPIRTSAPFTRPWHDRGLSIEIGRSTRTKGREHRQFARIHCQHNRVRIPIRYERNQVYAFTEVRRVTSALSLPGHIRNQACSLSESAQNEDPLRGRSLEGFAAVYVYTTCHVAGVSWSVEEVCDVSKATETGHQAAYGALNRNLGLPIAPADPAEYLSRFVIELDLGGDAERRAREYVVEAHDEGLVDGKNPCGIATTCLYIAASNRGEDCTQAEVADITDVTSMALREMYVALRE